MTIQEAIKKAIEGGYSKWTLEGVGHLDKIHFRSAFLDPSFWQSLGKALGWDERLDGAHSYYAKPGWLEAWHRFIDHLADGKTAESFFEELQ